MTNGEKMAVDRQTRVFEKTRQINLTPLRTLHESERLRYIDRVDSVNRYDLARTVINQAITDGMVQIDSHVETTTDENGVSHDTFVCRARIEVVVPKEKR